MNWVTLTIIGLVGLGLSLYMVGLWGTLILSALLSLYTFSMTAIYQPH